MSNWIPFFAIVSLVCWVSVMIIACAKVLLAEDQEVACMNICPRDGYIDHSLGDEPTYCVCKVDEKTTLKEAR